MVSWLLGFWVSWFLGFKVSRFLGVWFPGFLVSKFQSFKVPKIYQMSISCFLEDIDPVSKVPKNLLNGSSGMFGARLFQQNITSISIVLD